MSSLKGVTPFLVGKVILYLFQTSVLLAAAGFDPSTFRSKVDDLDHRTTVSYFFSVKLMFVGVVNFGQVQKIRFDGVKNFQSCSNPNFGHLHWSC